MSKQNMSLDQLKALLHYEPTTGIFTWKVSKSPRAQIGSQAGSIYSNGRYVIGIDGRYYGASRLAWFYMTGNWPTQVVDHINGNALDNRFVNLRDCSQSWNSQNQHKAHVDKVSCKLLGATWDKMWGNWKAQLTFQRRTIYLGRFKTAEEAHAAYLKGKRRIHAGCTL